MKVVRIAYELRAPEIYRGASHLNTIKEPDGSTFQLIDSKFYRIVVVTKFGTILGFDSFQEMWNHFNYGYQQQKTLGMGFDFFRLIGFTPSALLPAALMKYFLTGEMIYRGYKIEREPSDSWPLALHGHRYGYVHLDYDGPGDHRLGTAKTILDCVAEIDEKENQN